MTNTFDAANRLIETTRSGTTIEPIYNGVNDRVGQTVGLSTTYYALDVQGLPEVIYTSEGNLYLHLPGVIMAENAEGEVRYLLGDGLGSMRQAVDDNAELAAYHEFDPYGNPVDNTGGEPYGFTGEWWESDVGLLHLRARWYLPETGTFLSVDPVESEPPYQYVRGNPVNRVDPTGQCWWLSGEDYEQCVIGIAEAMWWYEENVNHPMNYYTALAVGATPLPDDPTVLQAIVSSHSQETDGFIIGGSVAANFIALLGVSDPIVGYLNGTCVPGTGGTFGVEVVYDFKHQERGLFRYHGGVLNFLGVGNLGGTGYMGLTRGFATQQSQLDPTGYLNGVGAYGGTFAVADVGFTPLKTPVTIGGVFIEAAPLLETSRNLNPQGVFATYVGANVGGGLSIPFVSGDIAVTNYTLLFGGNWPGRLRYALPFGTGGLRDDQIIERQRSIPRRMAAAAAMTNEINIIGGSAANPVTSFAIGKLWSWALRP